MKINLSLQQDFQANELPLKRGQIKKQIETTKLEEAILSGDGIQIDLEAELKEAIARKEECTKRHKGFFDARPRRERPHGGRVQRLGI